MIKLGHIGVSNSTFRPILHRWMDMISDCFLPTGRTYKPPIQYLGRALLFYCWLI